MYFAIPCCSQYFDFNNVSEGPTPRYGQFVSLYYSMYYRPSGGTAQLELIDATVDKQPYLQKHGEASSSTDTCLAVRKLYCVCIHPYIHIPIHPYIYIHPSIR